MPSRYNQFDRSRLQIAPLANRQHILHLPDVLAVGQRPIEFKSDSLAGVADAVAAAHKRGSAVVMMMGAHVIKQGLSRYVIDLLEHKWITHLALNGACTIHDYELARIGATSESVARYISEGRFGLWQESGEINDIVSAGNAQGMGLGECLGKHIEQSDLPHRDVSILAGAWRAGTPATVHIGIGYDIVAEHPNFDGAAWGQASYRDFLIFAKSLENLEGGAVLCYGSAVMGPEVYLKALSMVRNVAAREGKTVRHFTSAVFDLVDLSDSDLQAEAPKDSAEYYYRPFKTVLVRTVRDGGTSHYIRGDHLATMPALHALLTDRLR